MTGAATTTTATATATATAPSPSRRRRVAGRIGHCEGVRSCPRRAVPWRGGLRWSPRRRPCPHTPVRLAKTAVAPRRGREFDMERPAKSSTVSSKASRRRSNGRSDGQAVVATVNPPDIRRSSQLPAVMVVIRRELPRTGSVDSGEVPCHIERPRIHWVCARSPLHPSDPTRSAVSFPNSSPQTGPASKAGAGRRRATTKIDSTTQRIQRVVGS